MASVGGKTARNLTVHLKKVDSWQKWDTQNWTFPDRFSTSKLKFRKSPFFWNRKTGLFFRFTLVCKVEMFTFLKSDFPKIWSSNSLVGLLKMSSLFSVSFRGHRLTTQKINRLFQSPKNTKKIFLDFLKLEFYWTFLVLNDDPN